MAELNFHQAYIFLKENWTAVNFSAVKSDD